MTFQQALEHAVAQYQKILDDHKAGMTKEAMALVERNNGMPRPTGRRITIERERGDVVYRSQCPYVGVSTITSKKNGRL